MPLRFSLAFICAFGGLMFGGCATKIRTDVTQNPPPAERLAAFSAFELHPVALAAPLVGKGKNDQAVAKIQENLTAKAAPLIQKWNAAGASVMPPRTLVIQPEVTEFKFINGNARFWVGPMAGSSAVIMQAKMIEKETGRLIAAPVFYAKANAWSGSFTFGAMDNVMLIRIAGRLADYLSQNYNAAVGGPSGWEPEK